MVEAHYQAGLAVEQLSTLAKVCTPAQITTIMHLAAWPVIHIVGTPGFLQSTSRENKKKDLPDTRTERVNITLLPDPDALSLRKEQKLSPTRLLARIVYYTIQKNFSSGCTQTHVVSKFGLQPKTVALCITRRKYLGGTDKKATFKRRAAKSMTIGKGSGVSVKN